MKARTSLQMEEDAAKTLYLRLPHTIKNSKEIKELFVGEVKVKLPRQASRHCHVVFPSIENKMKNLKNIKKIKIDGKKIIAYPPKINPPEEKRTKEKKIRVPKPKPEIKITKTLHISNIKTGTKAQEIKDAFPGCVSVIMVKSKNTTNRIALIKLGSVQLAGEYLRKERESPEVRGNVLVIRADTRKRKKTSGKKKSTGLKIYDGETEETSEIKTEKTIETTKTEEQNSESSEESEEEEDDEEEEEESDEYTDVEEE